MRERLKIAIVAVGLLVSSSNTISAQAAASGPTAVGAQLGGLTEARGAEAVWINPANLGIFDGPLSSWNLLNIQTDLFLPFNGLDLKNIFSATSGGEFNISANHGAAIRALGSDRMGSNSSLSSIVHVIGVKTSGFAVSGQSAVYLTPRVSERSARIVSGDESAAGGGLTAEDVTASSEYSNYAAVSTVSMGIANNFGDNAKKIWSGLAVKASQIHALGSFQTILADAEAMNTAAGGTSAQVSPGDAGVIMSDLRLNNVILFGADLGITLRPTESSLFSIVAANIWQQNRIKESEEAFTHTEIAVIGEDASGNIVAAGGTSGFNGATIPSNLRTSAERVLSLALFTPAVKVGGSQEFLGGRLLWGYAHPWTKKPAMDRGAMDRFSFGYYGAGNISPRLSYGQKLDGQRTVSFGVATMGCGMRVGAGADYIMPTDGQSRFGAAFGLSFGRGPCRTNRR